MKITIEEEQLQHAQMQRLESLKLAFQIIDLFAIPSTEPKMFEKYCELREFLINHYTK